MNLPINERFTSVQKDDLKAVRTRKVHIEARRFTYKGRTSSYAYCGARKRVREDQPAVVAKATCESCIRNRETHRAAKEKANG